MNTNIGEDSGFDSITPIGSRDSSRGSSRGSAVSVGSPGFRPYSAPMTATLSHKGIRVAHSRESSVDDPLYIGSGFAIGSVYGNGLANGLANGQTNGFSNGNGLANGNGNIHSHVHSHHHHTHSMQNLSVSPPVTETSQVQLEYDPISRRKVLNTYEILREIGRGEHGKVKLAKDLVHNELVAIKIVSRRRRNKPSLRRKLTEPANEYEVKIRREIAIMKACNHKHIVRLREVLDDANSNKIYLVLEYLEKGEIRWKRSSKVKRKASSPSHSDDIPCCGAKPRRNSTFSETIVEDNQDNYLLSNEYLPNLTFKQSRKVFRDVLLGLEYLHMQGIVHRDIKPANLLVSAQNIVKISDFGVSFALSLNGLVADELELAKTAGTPAFFAPELCGGAHCKKEATDDDITPCKINYKIDIWALGVTLYCLLFGKVPFNADSEFELFQVIANDDFEFPTSIEEFNSPSEVTDNEFRIAKDLLSKLLDKDANTRLEIDEIRQHPFTRMDLEGEELQIFDTMNKEIQPEAEVANGSLVGVGARIRRSLVKAIRGSISGGSEPDVRNRFAALALDHSRSSSDDSYNSIKLNANGGNNSMILSEAFVDFSSRSDSRSGSISDATAFGASPRANSRSSLYSLAQNLIDSASTLRRGSSTSAIEAPQIETKRNVVGDLYLKNQTAVEAFKGIQEKDDRRRSTNPKEPKDIKDSKLRYSISDDAPSDKLIKTLAPKPLTLRVGPISIEARRPSSVMSLPLSESFASLDSLNDDYLTKKYHEFTTLKSASAAATMAATPVTPTGDLMPHTPTTPHISINAKFDSFNLDSLMRKTPANQRHKECIPPFQKLSSESLSDESSSLDDEDNLTLAFASKVGVASRPNVLSLSKRAKSHDSNLPRLIHYAEKSYDVPIMYLDNLPEFEDLPVGLVPALARGSVSTGMDPSVSIISNASTITPDQFGTSMSQTTMRDSSGSSSASPSFVRSPPTARLVSPLVNNAPSSELATANSHMAHQLNKNITDIGERSDHYNNHYKKEPVHSPFPNAIHLDNDKDAIRNSAFEKQGQNRPSCYRSNSVTVAILQNNR